MYSIFLLIFLLIFSNVNKSKTTQSEVCSLSANLLKCKSDYICNCVVQDRNFTNIDYVIKGSPSYDVDLFNINGYYLISLGNCDSDKKRLTPIIKTMEQPPTFGGDVIFTGGYLLDRLDIKTIKFNNPYLIKSLKFVIGSNMTEYIFKDFPRECGNFSIDHYETSIYNGSYLPGIVSSSEIENSVNIIYSGSNLYKPQMKIIGTGYPSLTEIQLNNSDTQYYNNVTYHIPEIKYCGEWLLKFYSCGNEHVNNQINVKNHPSISGLTTVSADNGGVVTITGSNFYSRSIDNSNSDSQDMSGYSISVFPKDSSPFPCTMIAYDIKESLLKCQMPPKTKGIKTNLKLVLTIDKIYNTTSNFSYDKPSISSVTQITYPSQGNAQFNISGKYLNDSSISSVIVKVPSDSSPYFVDQKCNIISKNDSDSAMIVEVPLKAYPGYIVIVSMDGNDQINSNIGILKFKPIIYNVTNSNTNGEIITISGVSLHSQRVNGEGNKLEDNNVSIKVWGTSNIACSNPMGIDGMHITCSMGSGVGMNLPMKVEIDDFKMDLVFSYNKPVIYHVQFTTQNTTTNITTLPGENYGNDISKVSITTGKLNIKVVSVDHKVLQFLIPNELNDINNLTIKVGSPGHENVIEYEFVVKPIITNINSIPLRGGVVTIYGRHLSPLSHISFRAPRNKPQGIVCVNVTVSQDRTMLYCKVEGVSSASVNQNGAGEGKLTCGSKLPIHMTLKGREAKNEKNITFSFKPPIITGSSGKNGVDMGLVTINGDNFNKKNLFVWIGDRVCKYPNIDFGFETLSCRLESIKESEISNYQNKLFDIKVEVDGQTGYLNNSFKYTFDFKVQKIQTWSIAQFAPGIIIVGIIAIVTIGFLIVYNLKRYIRIWKIRRALNDDSVNFQNRYYFFLF